MEHLKHPNKKKLDEAEACAFEVLAVLEQEGVLFRDFDLHDDAVYMIKAVDTDEHGLAVCYSIHPENGREVVSVELRFNDGTEENFHAAYLLLRWEDGIAAIFPEAASDAMHLPKGLVSFLHDLSIKGTEPKKLEGNEGMAMAAAIGRYYAADLKRTAS